MSATSKAILLTETATGNTAVIGANTFIYVVAEGTGSKVYYSNDGAAMKIVTVDESPATISAAADNLITVTDPILLTTSKINSDRIVDAGTGATIDISAQFQAASADSTATPVLVTDVAHGLTTGMIVTISGVTGTGAASVNGTYVIVAASVDTYSLTGTVGIGASTVVLTAATETYDLGAVYYNQEGAALKLISTRESKVQIQTLVNAIAL